VVRGLVVRGLVGPGGARCWPAAGNGPRRRSGRPRAGPTVRWVANNPLPLVSVFGLDEYSGTFSMLYADARGVSRVYSSTLVAGEWTIWGDRWTRDFAVSYAKLG
jgi:hypothetical protein